MSDKALLEKAKADYKLAADWWADNRKLWLEDAKFRAGDQWPDEIKKLRQQPGKERPCLVVDKLNQYIRQVVNDGRQNRPAIKVLPVDDRGDIKVAEGQQGLIRNICNRSRADEAFDTALDHAASCGYGFFRVLTDYAHKGTRNHEIIVKRVRNPRAVLLDPNIQAADGSDACFGFIEDDIPKDKYKDLYPKAKVTNWDSDRLTWDGWATEKTVRVCEYWYKLTENKNLLLLEDGTEVFEDEYWTKIQAGGEKIEVEDSRLVPSYTVKWCRMSGAEILEQKDWPGEFIPIIPVFGNEQDIDGKVIYSGLIRAAKDPQRLYNFSRSAFAERVALTPKAPWTAAEEAIDDHPEWGSANTGNHQVLKWRAYDDEGRQLPQPQRVSAADVPAGFSQDMQLAEHDIQASMGMYNASLGEKSNEKSGKAIMARQREGDTATFHYQDNLNRAISYLGRILVDLIPKVYDSRRVIRILGEDGKATTATVDPKADQAFDDSGKQPVYNLGIGQYDVMVTAGPSYTTKRQEAAEAMMQLTQAAPEIFKVMGDLMVQNMDWPGADKIAERLKKMLPPELRDEQEGESPEVAAVKNQAKQIIDQVTSQVEQAKQIIGQLQDENAAMKQELKNKDAEAEAKLQDSDTKAYEARTERLQVISPAVPAELVQQIVMQTVQALLQSPVQRPPDEPDAMVEMPIGPDPTQPPSGGFFTPEGHQ